MPPMMYVLCAGVRDQGGWLALTSKLDVHTWQCHAATAGTDADAVTLCDCSGPGCGTTSSLEHVQQHSIRARNADVAAGAVTAIAWRPVWTLLGVSKQTDGMDCV